MATSAAKTLATDDVERLKVAAWQAREKAFVIGPTKVGCAVLGADGNVYVGCNVEHRFRSHDVHAEVNAISSMVAAGCQSLKALLIAAQRDRFTPCGACMDWIMQFAQDGDCIVLAHRAVDADVQRYTAHELMPLYPR
jgi:cytidine deaminase